MHRLAHGNEGHPDPNSTPPMLTRTPSRRRSRPRHRIVPTLAPTHQRRVQTARMSAGTMPLHRPVPALLFPPLSTGPRRCEGWHAPDAPAAAHPYGAARPRTAGTRCMAAALPLAAVSRPCTRTRQRRGYGLGRKLSMPTMPCATNDATSLASTRAFAETTERRHPRSAGTCTVVVFICALLAAQTSLEPWSPDCPSHKCGTLHALACGMRNSLAHAKLPTPLQPARPYPPHHIRSLSAPSNTIFLTFNKIGFQT